MFSAGRENYRYNPMTRAAFETNDYGKCTLTLHYMQACR